MRLRLTARPVTGEVRSEMADKNQKLVVTVDLPVSQEIRRVGEIIKFKTSDYESDWWKVAEIKPDGTVRLEALTEEDHRLHRLYDALCDISFELTRLTLNTDQMFNNIAEIVDRARINNRSE
jgi:hypothetical protein